MGSALETSVLISDDDESRDRARSAFPEIWGAPTDANERLWVLELIEESTDTSSIDNWGVREVCPVSEVDSALVLPWPWLKAQEILDDAFSRENTMPCEGRHVRLLDGSWKTMPCEGVQVR